MATICTRGITVDAEGFRTINKEYRGERIFARLGLYVRSRRSVGLRRNWSVSSGNWSEERTPVPCSLTAPNGSCSNPSTNGVGLISRGIWDC